MPDTECFEAGGRYVYVLRDIRTLDLDPPAAGLDVVICGHSHKPQNYTKNGVLYLNPGSAGPRRFSLPIMLAELILDVDEVRAQITTLVRH